MTKQIGRAVAAAMILALAAGPVWAACGACGPK